MRDYQAAYRPRPNWNIVWNKIETVTSSFLESFESVSSHKGRDGVKVRSENQSENLVDTIALNIILDVLAWACRINNIVPHVAPTHLITLSRK